MSYNSLTFKQMLHASLKSEDTEEWLDIHFNRPIGLVFALIWAKLGVKPNTVTILSFFLGAAAGFMFYFTDFWHNLAGVFLLMFANFCDSTDGQLARLTNQKSLLGRVLDGISADVWFVPIYVCLALRLMPQTIPGTDETTWGLMAWVLSAMAGLWGHTPNARIADYYRQIHLFFLFGKDGSELDSSSQQYAIYESLPREKWFDRLFYKNYAGYCRLQEKSTPWFQKFFAAYQQLDENGDIRTKFLNGSRPLMKYANFITFNSRAIVLYLTALLNCPWFYLLFEIIVLNAVHVYMHRRHERLCKRLYEIIQV